MCADSRNINLPHSFFKDTSCYSVLRRRWAILCLHGIAETCFVNKVIKIPALISQRRCRRNETISSPRSGTCLSFANQTSPLMRRDFGAFPSLQSDKQRLWSDNSRAEKEDQIMFGLFFFLFPSAEISPMWACFRAPTSLVPSPHMRVMKPKPFRLVMTNSCNNEKISFSAYRHVHVHKCGND